MRKCDEDSSTNQILVFRHFSRPRDAEHLSGSIPNHDEQSKSTRDAFCCLRIFIYFYVCLVMSSELSPAWFKPFIYALVMLSESSPTWL